MGFIYLYIFEEFATAALTREAGANRERDGSIKASQLVRVGQSGTARALILNLKQILTNMILHYQICFYSVFIIIYNKAS